MKRILTVLAVLATCSFLRGEEPPYYEEYRQAAVAVSDSVTSAVDSIKTFRLEISNHDLATSSALRDEYRQRLSCLDAAITQAEKLLTTATAVRKLGYLELHAAENFPNYEN